MQLHELQRNTANKTSKRVGRGGKRGKTSGRGHKGQKARSGNSTRPAIRDVIKKLPKKRGYRFNSTSPKATAVNVADLEKAFSAGDTVNPATLHENGVITNRSSVAAGVKILGNGELTTKLAIQGCAVSKTAHEKITSAGGTVTA
jgi:large subunit ribosomal protein L15